MKGPCTDNVSMWYFDSDNQQCRVFEYSGCQGNANRFISENECKRVCGSSRNYYEENEIDVDEEVKRGEWKTSVIN
jgi:hypothetical protein